MRWSDRNKSRYVCEDEAKANDAVASLKFPASCGHIIGFMPKFQGVVLKL